MGGRYVVRSMKELDPDAQRNMEMDRAVAVTAMKIQMSLLLRLLRRSSNMPPDAESLPCVLLDGEPPLLIDLSFLDSLARDAGNSPSPFRGRFESTRSRYRNFFSPILIPITEKEEH